MQEILPTSGTFFILLWIMHFQVGMFAANTIGVLNISAGSASIINSGYELISGEQAPSTLVWLQFTSSVLFFGHAVYSFKGAQTIIDETQTKVLQDYKNSLRSNRHRLVPIIQNKGFHSYQFASRLNSIPYFETKI